jgi:hypothetical protein
MRGASGSGRDAFGEVSERAFDDMVRRSRGLDDGMSVAMGGIYKHKCVRRRTWLEEARGWLITISSIGCVWSSSCVPAESHQRCFESWRRSLSDTAMTVELPTPLKL